VTEIYSKIEPVLDEIKTIIEPFCGSSAVSFYISTKHPKRFRYILNDIDPSLTELYKIMQSDVKPFEKEINLLIDEFNTFKDDIKRKEWYNQLKKSTSIYSYLFTNKYFNLRSCLYPTFDRLKSIKPFKFSDYPIYRFLQEEDVTILSKEGINIIQEYDYKDHLIILDPPYISTCNSFYIGKDMNIYEYLLNNREFNSKLIIILEDIWMVNLIFKDYLRSKTYKKSYNLSQKKTNHVIFSNYK
jgi:site-specific DNA-adenine methylase